MTDPRTEAIEVMARAAMKTRGDHNAGKTSDELHQTYATAALDALLSHPELVLGLVGEQVGILSERGTFFEDMAMVTPFDRPVYVAKPVVEEGNE